jgi:hypothetical protein
LHRFAFVRIHLFVLQRLEEALHLIVIVRVSRLRCQGSRKNHPLRSLNLSPLIFCFTSGSILHAD